jgi:hypothetical protein
MSRWPAVATGMTATGRLITHSAQVFRHLVDLRTNRRRLAGVRGIRALSQTVLIKRDSLGIAIHTRHRFWWDIVLACEFAPARCKRRRDIAFASSSGEVPVDSA